MFDSSKCLKAEAFLVSTANTLQKKKVFRSISDLKTRSSSLPRSYPHVFPSKYPTLEISVAHLYTAHISSASPRGLGLTRTSAVPSLSKAARAPASRPSAADRCCALLCLAAALEDGVSPQHFQSVLTNAASPIPSLKEISHSSDSLNTSLKWEAWPHLDSAEPRGAQPSAFPPIASLRQLPLFACEFQHLLGIFLLLFEGT